MKASAASTASPSWPRMPAGAWRRTARGRPPGASGPWWKAGAPPGTSATVRRRLRCCSGDRTWWLGSTTTSWTGPTSSTPASCWISARRRIPSVPSSATTAANSPRAARPPGPISGTCDASPASGCSGATRSVPWMRRRWRWGRIRRTSIPSISAPACARFRSCAARACSGTAAARASSSCARARLSWARSGTPARRCWNARRRAASSSSGRRRCCRPASSSCRAATRAAK